MRIEKKYFDEGEWKEVTEKDARETLEAYYQHVTPRLLEQIEAGYTVYTDMAEYRKPREATR